MLVILLAFALARSQSRVIEFEGEVKDQHGDVIAGAKIILSAGSTRETVSDDRGRFRITGLAAGAHTLKIEAEGFAPHEEKLTLSDSKQRLAITLYPSIKETVSVKDDPSEVSLDPQRAAGAQVLTEQVLKSLPDDPDRLSDLLQLLATSSGSAPGQATVTVDGFSNEGRLPPKSSIREVRINSNIFSAEYDKPPYRGGRIDVYTKPGAGSFHGEAAFNFNNSSLNARDVFARQRAPITTRRYGLQLGGPLVRKRAGFLIDFEARDINESATVNAVILDTDFQPSNFVANVPTPKRLLIGSLRGDWQLNQFHTFIARYDFNEDRSNNQGAGGFNLPERASTSRAKSHALRFAETAIIGKSIFNEARLALTSTRTTERATSRAPAITVSGAFSSGGSAAQSIAQTEKRIELTNNLSIVARNHSLKIGAQITVRRVSDSRADNFNGTFIFGGAIAPLLDDDGEIIADDDGKPVMTNISGLEQYRRALLDLAGGRPTRFLINRGDPLVEQSQWMISGFLQDEWHVRQDLLISLGLRYESQTAPSDRVSLGPRIGLGYSPDKKRRWVLRARAGLFYDRITLPIALETLRLDGNRQEQIIIDEPSFPDPFKGGAAVEAIPTVRRISADLRPPVSFQAQAGFERQLSRGWKIEMSHYWSRSWGSIRSRNINAPIINEGDDPLSAPRPFGVKENILQFESSGSLTGRVLFIGVNQSSNRHFNFFSGYLWFDFRTDADHPFLLAQSSYNADGEWARPFWQASHRVFVVGLINLPWKMRASTEVNLATGAPFNITTGRDNNGDGNFNDRPNRAVANDPRAVMTHLGAFDPSVINGTLGRNAGTNPFNAAMDMNLSRTFAMGGKGKNDRGHQLTLNVRASNLLNRANLGGIDGVLNSPFFGRANNAAPSRRIEIGARFSF